MKYWMLKKAVTAASSRPRTPSSPGFQGSLKVSERAYEELATLTKDGSLGVRAELLTDCPRRLQGWRQHATIAKSPSPYVRSVLLWVLIYRKRT